jgi:hypothetical protein
MKRKLFLAFFIVFGIAQSQAQLSMKAGIRTGINFSKLTNYNTDFKEGFYLGGQLALKFNKLYTLQPELVFSQQGAKETNYYYYDDFNQYDPIYYTDSEVNYRIDYLSLGVINKFYFSKGFHLLAGPSLDFKINDNFHKDYFSNDVIGFDLALVGGFGYSFSNGLSIEARFKQGMIDIFGNNYNTNVDENGNGNYDEVVLNQSFQIGVSYMFNLN